MFYPQWRYFFIVDDYYPEGKDQFQENHAHHNACKFIFILMTGCLQPQVKYQNRKQNKKTESEICKISGIKRFYT